MEPDEIAPIEIPPDIAEFLLTTSYSAEQIAWQFLGELPDMKVQLRAKFEARHTGPGPSPLSGMKVARNVAFPWFSLPKSAFFSALEPLQRVIEANLARALSFVPTPITPLAPIRRFKRAMRKAMRKHPRWRWMKAVPAEETLNAMRLASGQRVWTDDARPPR